MRLRSKLQYSDIMFSMPYWNVNVFFHLLWKAVCLSVYIFPSSHQQISHIYIDQCEICSTKSCIFGTTEYIYTNVHKWILINMSTQRHRYKLKSLTTIGLWPTGSVTGLLNWGSTVWLQCSEFWCVPDFFQLSQCGRLYMCMFVCMAVCLHPWGY